MSAVSFAARPRTEHRSEVGAQRRPLQHEPAPGTACRDARALFEGKGPRRLRNIQSVAERKLAQLDAALTLNFLRAPPSKRLEALRGDRAGPHSILINDPWRICFVWTAAGPGDVEIVDDH